MVITGNENVGATHEGAVILREFASSIEDSKNNIENYFESFKKKVAGYEQLGDESKDIIDELFRVAEIFHTHRDNLHKLTERMKKKADEIDELAGREKMLVFKRKM